MFKKRKGKKRKEKKLKKGRKERMGIVHHQKHLSVQETVVKLSKFQAEEKNGALSSTSSCCLTDRLTTTGVSLAKLVFIRRLTTKLPALTQVDKKRSDLVYLQKMQGLHSFLFHSFHIELLMNIVRCQYPELFTKLD